MTDLTAQSGAPVTKGRLRCRPGRRRRPARRRAVPVEGRRPPPPARRPIRSGCGRCPRRPACRRWNSSSVGVPCGATPQKLRRAARRPMPGRRRGRIPPRARRRRPEREPAPRPLPGSGPSASRPWSGARTRRPGAAGVDGRAPPRARSRRGRRSRSESGPKARSRRRRSRAECRAGFGQRVGLLQARLAAGSRAPVLATLTRAAAVAGGCATASRTRARTRARGVASVARTATPELDPPGAAAPPLPGDSDDSAICSSGVAASRSPWESRVVLDFARVGLSENRKARRCQQSKH